MAGDWLEKGLSLSGMQLENKETEQPCTTTQDKPLHMDITRWSWLKSDSLYSLQSKMEELYTASKNKTRSWLWLKSWVAYFQIQTWIEKSRETTEVFRYDLNQIPYYYTVEVTNRPSPRKRNAKMNNYGLRRPYK